MKYLKYLLIAFIISVASSKSYSQSFQRGDNLAGLGFGVGSSLGDFSASSSSPGIALHYELGYLNLGGPGVLGLGGYLGHKSFTYNGSQSTIHYSQKWNYTIIGFRAAYHYNGFTKISQLDPYGGLMLSYDAVNYTFSSDNGEYNPGGTYNSGLGVSAYLGGRWFFTKNIAAYMELGFGVSNLTIGACYKF